MKVPQRDIDTGNALGKRAEFTAFKGDYLGIAGERLINFRRRGQLLSDEKRRQESVDQARPMLGPARGKITKYLPPA